MDDILYAVPKSTLVGIADAIRTKTGSDEQMTVPAFASAIEGIPGIKIETYTIQTTTETTGGWAGVRGFLDTIIPNLDSVLLITTSPTVSGAQSFCGLAKTKFGYAWGRAWTGVTNFGYAVSAEDTTTTCRFGAGQELTVYRI